MERLVRTTRAPLTEICCRFAERFDPDDPTDAKVCSKS